MKMAIFASSVLLLAAGSKAAVLIDNDFSAVGAEIPVAVAPENKLDVASHVDKGWWQHKKGAGKISASGVECPGYVFVKLMKFAAQIGQINTDNKATTGNVRFQVTIGSNAEWDTNDRAELRFEVFGLNGSGSGAGPVPLDGKDVSGDWTPIGTASVEISGAMDGTVQTGVINMGTGWDFIAVRVNRMQISGTFSYKKYLYIKDIRVIQESLIFGCLGLDALVASR